MPFAPLYVHRDLLNADEVVRHFVAQGLRSTIAAADMHVTVVYSKRAMEWDAVPPAMDELVIEPMRGARGTGRYGVDRQMERLGEHGVLTMVLQSQNSGVQQLIRRWREYLAAGASHDFDGFTAHVTISYAGKGADLDAVEPFPGELRFGPEIHQPIKEEWKPDMSKETPASKGRPGDRDSPCVVDSPGALDRACARVWQPTEGQAAGGNYKMAHVVVGGIHVTVETPLDRMRAGTGRDGKPWSVRMPAHYGYAKRTEGADGDHVDVYVGPEAHRAAALPVWIVDQVDADSRAFDEHKVFLGFPDAKTVGRTYLAAFSDGRGRDRAGACARTTFDAFRRWLASPAKRPVAYARSATFSPSPCPCGCGHDAGRCDTGRHPGGPMTTDATPAAAAVPVVKGAGLLQSLMSKAWGSLTPADRKDLLASASLDSTTALGKAANLLGEGDDHTHEEHVYDLFDGPHDQHAPTVMAHGPHSSVPPGKEGVGPGQSASGEGAPKMEREYSEHTPQTGVQRATERLGAAIAGHRRAMKALLNLAKAMTDRMNVLEAATGTATAIQPGAEAKAIDIDAVVKAAVAKALPVALAQALPAMIKAVVKAKGESESDKEDEKGEEDEEEEDDDEASETESGSGTDIEIVNENEADDEDEADEGKKAAAKAAANERLIAKGLVRLAKRAAREAGEAVGDDRYTTAVRLYKAALSRLAKARTHLAVAKALRDGRVGPSGKAIAEQIDAVAKAAKEMRAKNQDKWPEMKKTAKAATEAASAAPAVSPDTMKAIAQMQETVKAAMAGYALMQGTMEQVLKTVGGQSRDPTSNGLPPSTELFKAATDKRTRLNEAYVSGAITAADRDKGMDALPYLEQAAVGGAPGTLADSAIAHCVPAVQAILRAAA